MTGIEPCTLSNVSKVGQLLLCREGYNARPQKQTDLQLVVSTMTELPWPRTVISTLCWALDCARRGVCKCMSGELGLSASGDRSAQSAAKGGMTNEVQKQYQPVARPLSLLLQGSNLLGISSARASVPAPPLEEHLRSLGQDPSCPICSKQLNLELLKWRVNLVRIQVFPGSQLRAGSVRCSRMRVDIFISHLTGKQHLKKVRQLAPRR